MTRGVWIFAAMALVLAFLGGSRSGSTSTPTPSPAGASAPAAGTPASTGAVCVGERLLREHLGQGIPPSGPSIPLLLFVASLPDPQGSPLDWAFDAGLDSLRRAFERCGWVLVRHETWQGPAATGGLRGRPGALLFHELEAGKEGTPPRLALVYLVGELSTSGIDRPAFAEALRERAELIDCLGARLGLTADPLTSSILRIVGPYFSGTSPSLRAALDVAPRRPGERVEIVSGTATSESNYEILTGEKSEESEKSEEAAESQESNRVFFHTTLHTDATLQSVLANRVLPRLGLDSRYVAILQEQTTAYGAEAHRDMEKGDDRRGEAEPLGSQDPLKGMLVVPFPMSIGALRQAYQRNGTAVRSETPLPGRAAETVLPLDLEGHRTARETPGPTSALTPPSIDLLLEETTRMLAQNGIRAVLLFATDDRDKLFLGSELRRRLPDLQLITTEGSVLFLWPSLNRWLRGMVVVSTYPMLLRDPSWVPSTKDRQQFLFSNEGAEGIFNAQIYQLREHDLMVDYAGPTPGGPSRPPVWVTTVGAGTMLPLLAVDAEEHGAQPWAAPRIEVTPEQEDRTSQHGFLGVCLLLALAVWFLLMFLQAALADRLGRSFSARMHRRDGGLPLPFGGQAARIHLTSISFHHELYVLCHLMALWSFLVPSACLLVTLPAKDARQWTATAFSCVAVVVGLIVLLVRAWRLFQRRPHGLGSTVDFGTVAASPSTEQRLLWGMEWTLRRLIFVLGVGYFGGTIWLAWSILSIWYSDAGTYPLFLHRAIEVDQGVSLMVPIALIGALLVLWCRWHMRRLSALACNEPAEVAFDPEEGESGQDSPARIRRRLFRAIPDSRTLLVQVPLVFLLVFFCLRIQRPLDDLVLGSDHVPSPFATLVRIGIPVALASSAWGILRVRALWVALAALLADWRGRIQGLPFAAIKKDLKATVNLGLVPKDSRAQLEIAARAAWGQLEEHELPEPLAKALAEARAAGAIERRRDKDQVLEPKLADALVALEAARQTGSLDPAVGKKVDRVLAVELLLYIEWVLQFLRAFVLFLVGSILVSLALVWSYPFQPQHLVQLLAFGVFGGAIVLLLWLVASMNRNIDLSRMADTDPGFTWDQSFVVNLLLFVLAPVLTLLSSQEPAMRQLLEKVIQPLLTTLAVG